MPFILLIPAVVFFSLFTIWPLFTVFKLSLYQTNFITTTFVGLQNYIDLFFNEMFVQAIKNSWMYIILMVIGMTTSSITIALMVAKLNKKWQDTSRILLYIPVLSGGIIIAQVWRWIFSMDGVVNWLLSLFNLGPVNWFGQGITAIPVIVFIVVVASIGSYVIILLASILSIDRSIFEAAMIDGASNRQIKRLITIPLLMPTILLIALLSMIGSLQIFETIFALCQQVYAYTPTFSIYTVGFKFSKWGLASAQSVILMVITVILSIIKSKVEKYNDK